ncbi:MAG: domain containing protein [Actinomycetia bacterium]|nr:domain containing protein [Actinomycetes bacterium]
MLVDDRVTIATPEGVDVELILAGLGSRFLARFLDTLIQAVLIFALVVITLAGGNGRSRGWIAAVTAIGTFLVVFAYDVAFEVLGSGRTPGKRVAGIRVVGLRGQPIDFLASAVRNVVRVVELVFLYLPSFVLILTTSRDQRLGDIAAGTLVVRETFGGRASDVMGPTAPAPLTVAPDTVAGWDVSTITPAEVLAVRQFLDRRLALPWHIRAYLAGELVQRLTPRLTGVPDNVHPEFVLEGVMVAKHARA